MPNVSRPQMTSVANPPVVAGNIQYGPSYKMQYQKRSTTDKSAVKYTGFLPLEGVYEEGVAASPQKTMAPTAKPVTARLILRFGRLLVFSHQHAQTSSELQLLTSISVWCVARATGPDSSGSSNC